jgi:hypothetical protein
VAHGELTIRAEGDRFVLTGSGTADRTLLGEAVAALSRALGEQLAVDHLDSTTTGDVVVRRSLAGLGTIARGVTGTEPATPPRPVPV